MARKLARIALMPPGVTADRGYNRRAAGSVTENRHNPHGDTPQGDEGDGGCNAV